LQTYLSLPAHHLTAVLLPLMRQYLLICTSFAL
jgi:hypothetical protein